MLLIILLLIIFIVFCTNTKEFYITQKGGGESGKPGKKGPPGDKGDPGPRGDPGRDAHSSDVGWKGKQGDRGPIGREGEKGYLGETGEKGPRGLKGNTGIHAYNHTWKDIRIPSILNQIIQKIKTHNQKPPEKNPPINLNLHTLTDGVGKIQAKYRVTESMQSKLQPYNSFEYYI
tara:strand:- start:856 stop:1380 length:525 start_codon:yes stop_codon:yes gene_type:complete